MPDQARLARTTARVMSPNFFMVLSPLLTESDVVTGFNRIGELRPAKPESTDQTLISS
jgi:hypothetical protein